MGILDEAIREHLDLKRKHGAGESELKQLEDEAFGPPARPGEAEGPQAPESEAPTAYMEAPEAVAPPEAAVALPPTGETPVEQRQEAQPAGEAQPAPTAEKEHAEREPAEEEHPAMEHETILPPVEEAPEAEVPEPEQREQSASELERESVAEQPTELYDVEAELAVPPETPAPEEPYEEEAAPLEAEIAEDDDFFDEQSLSDELDQALDAVDEEDAQPAPEAEVALEEAEADAPPEEQPPLSPPSEGEEGYDEEHEDVLEETPEFLQDTPEHDRLWFEQKPPKDFDFDD